MADNQPELDLDNYYGAGRPVDDAGRSINVMIKGHVGEELQMIVLRRRLAGPLVLSQCNDLERIGSPTSLRPAQEGRADTFRYHLLSSHTDHFPIDNHYNLERDYFRNMCPDIARRFTIYGKIGRGSKCRGVARTHFSIYLANLFSSFRSNICRQADQSTSSGHGL